jgi:hypothetical protein
MHLVTSVPPVRLVHHRTAASFAHDVGDAFRTHLGGMLATGQNFTVIAGVKNIRLAIAAHGDLTGEHHDPRIEIMRMQVFGEIRLLSTI